MKRTANNGNPQHPRSDCDQARELLASYSLGTTNAAESRLVEAMLHKCPGLADELESYLALADGLLHMIPDTADPPPVSGLMARIQAEEQVSGTSTPDHSPQHHHHVVEPPDAEELLRHLDHHHVEMAPESPPPKTTSIDEIAGHAPTEPRSEPEPESPRSERRPRSGYWLAAAAVMAFIVTNLALIVLLRDVQRDQQQIAVLLLTQNAPPTETPVTPSATPTLTPTITPSLTATSSPTVTPSSTVTPSATVTPIPPSSTPAPVGFEQTHTRQLIAAGPVDANATLVWNSSEGRVFLTVSGLPPLEPDEAYQVWAVRADREISLGQFTPDESGTFSDFLEPPPEPIETFELLGISVEPATGSPNPTTDHIITGQI